MQTITTRYHGPTNYRASRVVARHSGGPYKASVSTTHDATLQDSHDRAAILLCRKLNWDGVLVRGSLGPDTNIYVFDVAYARIKLPRIIPPLQQWRANLEKI